MNCGSELPRQRPNPERGLRNRQPSGYDDDNEPFYHQKNPYRESFGLLRARIRDLEQGGNSVSDYVRRTSTSNAREEEINNRDDFGVGGGGGGERRKPPFNADFRSCVTRGPASRNWKPPGLRCIASSVTGHPDQQQQNIAKIKELTRGQVFTDTGGGYVQTDPNAIVTIRIDDQGNIVGSTTSREIPDTPWDTFLKRARGVVG